MNVLRAIAIDPRRTLLVAALTVAATCAPAPNPGPGGGEQERAAGAGDARVAHGPAGHAPLPSAAPASERSLHLLPAAWTDQHGEARTLADLGGRVNVVAMAYTHCTFACPRILARMKAIEARVEEDPRVRFVLVSIDPRRDTPERLADFARSARLDPGRWTLLSGSDDDVLALSVLLGVKYQATDDGEFAHSNVLTVLGPDGVVVHRAEGLGADLEPVVEAVRSAAADAHARRHADHAP